MDEQKETVDKAGEPEPTIVIVNGMTVEQVAEYAHEVSRLYARTALNQEQPPWAEAPEWQKTSAIHGVERVIETVVEYNCPPKAETMHNNWMREKLLAGWKYGPEKNPETLEHPCLLPYEFLSLLEKRKDTVFSSAVMTLLERRDHSSTRG